MFRQTKVGKGAGFRLVDEYGDRVTVTETSPRAPAVRGSYAKTADRRSSIIQASFEIFASVGYQRGSIKDIADLIGMSRAGVQHHFPDKISLLEAVLRLRDGKSQERLAGRHGIEFLRGLLMIDENNLSIPGVIELYCVLAAESAHPDHSAHEYFVARYETVVSGIETALAEARDQGHLVDGIDPLDAAVDLMAMSDGLQLQWLYNRELDIVAKMRRHLQSLVTVAL